MGKVVAYKGFNKDLTCRGFQYEVGKEYELPNGLAAIACERGFHACENPFDVLDYYGDIVDNRYCVVEQSGSFDKSGDKAASSHISIKAEIGFEGLFDAGVEWLKEATKDTLDNEKIFTQIASSENYAEIGSICKYVQIGSSGDHAKIGSSGNAVQIGSSGDSAQIGSSGDFAHIASSGDDARIGSNGDCAQIAASGTSVTIGSVGDCANIVSNGESATVGSTGEDSVICCTGRNSIAKAKKGSWITLAEWEYDEEKDRLVPKCVKTECVDGERIKADTWYRLIDGEFVEQ